MLSEIFFLKLEAEILAREDASDNGSVRFIPRAPSIMPLGPESELRDFATSLNDHCIKDNADQH